MGSEMCIRDSDNFTAGIQVLGLAEEGVGWALDEHNEAMITDEMKAAVEEVQASIIAGDISVKDYTDGNNCDI